MVLIFKSTHFAGTTAKIGQMQLLRRQIANALNVRPHLFRSFLLVDCLRCSSLPVVDKA